jgi:diguanylate cyclase (GGDEF)-like protein
MRAVDGRTDAPTDVRGSRAPAGRPDATPAVPPDAPDWDALVDDLAFLADHDPAACLDRAAAPLELARAHGLADAEMRVSLHVGLAHLHLGHDAAALAAAERTAHLAEQTDDLVWQSRALVVRGLVHHAVGHVEDAVDLLRRAVELRREADDVAGTAEVLNHLGTVYTGMTQFGPEAAAALSESRRLWLAQGDGDQAAVALVNLARAFVVTGRRITEANPRGSLAAARRALTFAQQAVEEADAAGLTRFAIDARLAVVGAHLLAGELEAAGRTLEAARTMVERFPTRSGRLSVHRETARWLVLVGRHDDAVAEVQAGLALCESLERPAERVDLLESLVAAHEGRGDLPAALAALHELHDLTVRLAAEVAERRSALLSSRLEVERARRAAEAERRRAAALEERNARLAWEASHDALTGLANRRVLDAQLLRLTTSRSRFAVALLDTDHFKRVNDTWSHQVGDQVLARLAAELRRTLRGDDLAARYGGEEFAVVLGDVDTATAVLVCERIRRAVEAMTWDDIMPGHRITVSMGLATSEVHGTPEGLLAAADAALYAAKAGGRNLVRVAAGAAD